MIKPAELVEIANADSEFKLAARLWSTTLRLDVGEQPYVMRVDDGRISEFAPCGSDKLADLDWTVRIFAAPEEWNEFLKPVPRAFYQDLTGAVMRHGFQIEGDLLSFNPYYAAMRRLFDIMRQADAA
ncbi:MAG: hypothetical protein ACREQN_11330 [Candidatus Binataceae bacterium]